MQPLRRGPKVFSMLGRRTRTASIEVIIAGGGVAALETALGVRELARDRVRLTLVAPMDDFVYRPMAVFEPFLPRPAAPRHLSLAEFANDVDASVEVDHVAAVDCERRLLRTSSQRELPYDALVIATGARARDVLPAALAMSGDNLGESLREVIRDIDGGSVHSLALVVPSQMTWPLPAYELALLTREHVREKGIELRISIVTAEQGPLAVYGPAVSAAVAEVLSAAEIEVLAGVDVEMPRAGELTVHSSDSLRFDRVVAVPRLVGPAIAGLPSDADGFLPITRHAEVAGVERVYAVGDATDFPVKQGGISAEQADAAAESIAALAGLPVQPHPFGTLVHGMLLTSRSGQYLYLSARIDEGVACDSHVSETPTWSPPAKIAARYLGPYLDKRWAVLPPGNTNWHAWSFLRWLDAS